MARYIALLMMVIFCAQASSFSRWQKWWFVKDVNRLIDSIRVFDDHELDTRFFRHGTDARIAELVFFGEDHFDPQSLLDRTRALEYLVRENDIILVEGEESGAEFDCTKLIFIQQMTYDFRKAHEDYDPGTYQHFKSLRLPLWEATKHKLKLSSLNISKARCFGWDDLAAFKGSQTRPINIPRNLKMVQQLARMRARQESTSRIFILAGAMHLPMAEMLAFKTVSKRWAFFDNHLLDIVFAPPGSVEALTPSEFYPAVDNILKWATTAPIHLYTAGLRTAQVIPCAVVAILKASL